MALYQAVSDGWYDLEGVRDRHERDDGWGVVSPVSAIDPRFGPSRRLPVTVADERKRIADDPRERSFDPAVDLDRGAHPCPQLRPVGSGRDLDPHRDALHDLHPVAGRILRRQE